MKLNLVVWREARVRLEVELKKSKTESRRHRAPEEPFDFGALFLLKAEVTRLYCLRRAVKQQLHAVGRLRCIRLGHANGRRYTELVSVTDLPSQEALLRAEAGWLETFLI
jgi:hypothetical protein